MWDLVEVHCASFDQVGAYSSGSSPTPALAHPGRTLGGRGEADRPPPARLRTSLPLMAAQAVGDQLTLDRLVTDSNELTCIDSTSTHAPLLEGRRAPLDG